MNWTPESVAQWVEDSLQCSLYADRPELRGVVAESLGAVPELPPLGVLMDLAGALLIGPAARRPLADPRVRKAVAAYDEHFFGRLVHSRGFRAVRDAARGRTNPAPVVALFMELVLTRVFRQPGPPHGLVRAALEDRRADSGPTDHIAQAYDEIVRAARQTPTLLDEADLVALQNVEALSGAAQRLALRQLVEAATELDRAMPKRLRASRRKGPVPTHAKQESTYPVGGYASIGTQGGIESLVASELIYMERDARVDPFTVRWASGELLRYQRDEGLHHRPKRAIRLVLDESLVAARVLDSGAKYQRLVQALASVVVCVRRLVHELSRAELSIEIVVPEALAPEQALLKIALWSKSGVLSFTTQPQVEADTHLRWLTSATDDALEVKSVPAYRANGQVYEGWPHALRASLEDRL